MLHALAIICEVLDRLDETVDAQRYEENVVYVVLVDEGREKEQYSPP
jgi:hypothetical protein